MDKRATGRKSGKTELVTVEGLADGDTLHPVQEAFSEFRRCEAEHRAILAANGSAAIEFPCGGPR